MAKFKLETLTNILKPALSIIGIGGAVGGVSSLLGGGGLGGAVSAVAGGAMDTLAYVAFGGILLLIILKK